MNYILLPFILSLAVSWLYVREWISPDASRPRRAFFFLLLAWCLAPFFIPPSFRQRLLSLSSFFEPPVQLTEEDVAGHSK
jgi:predicted membrane channel-forming protein YqfA (hemolysin III family)